MEGREEVCGKGRVCYEVEDTESLNRLEKMKAERNLDRERRQCVYQEQRLRRTDGKRRR